MSNIKKFKASVTISTQATKENIWALWIDVNNWNKWDCGIQKSKILTEFKINESFFLTPQGSDEISIKITSVTVNREFSDEVLLPFGSLRNIHVINKTGDDLSVTHSIIAEISEDMSEMFGLDIWPHMKSGLAESVNNLLLLAEKNLSVST